MSAWRDDVTVMSKLTFEPGATTTAGNGVVSSSPFAAATAGAIVPTSNVPTASAVIAREMVRAARRAVVVGVKRPLLVSPWSSTARSFHCRTGFAQPWRNTGSVLFSEYFARTPGAGKWIRASATLGSIHEDRLRRRLSRGEAGRHRSAGGDGLDADVPDRLEGVDEPRVVGGKEDEVRSLRGCIVDERIRVGRRRKPAEGIDARGADDPYLVGERA